MAKKPNNFFGRSPSKQIEPAKSEWPKNFYEAGSNKTLATEALGQGLCLTFDYHNCRRIVGVFTIGMTQAGRQAMSAFQVDGQSNDRPLPYWGTFCFDECFDVALLNLPAPATPPDYNKGAKQFKFIEREV